MATKKAPPSGSLRAVAEMAGVSVATVSRVMSGSDHPVADGTRERVLEAADRLAFQPNRLARALVTARSQTVGVIVHDISDPYFGEIVKGLEDGVHTDGYRLFVASSDRDPERELEYVRAFIAYQADAIVFAASGLTDAGYREELTELLDRFQERGGVTVVLSDHFLPGPRVHFDNRTATAELVRYLADRGHSRIGFLRGPGYLEVTRARQAGYEDAVARLGLVADDAFIADGSFTMMGGREATAEILARTHVTAILASNDQMALGATRHLLAQGIDVPSQMSVAGFDDSPMAEFGPVPLTTMRLPTYDLGRAGADLLLGRLAGRDPDDPRLLAQIVERDSVGPAA